LIITSSTGVVFSGGDEVSIFTTATNSSGVLVNASVLVSVLYPNGTTLINGTATLESQGRTKFNFTLSGTVEIGVYAVNVDANYSGDVDSDQTSFQVSSLLEELGGSFVVQMSDFDEVAAGGQYRTKVWIFDLNGSLLAPDVTPTITLFDPVRNIIVSGVSMNLDSVGIYTYNFTTSSSQMDGTWETVANVTVGGVSVFPSDFWELESSPAEVKINAITDNTVPTITADITITNEGSGSQEYQYEYCIVVDQTNACGGGDDTDYASRAKLLAAGESFNPLLTLNVPVAGDYYFKIVVFFGTETSGASQLFTAVAEGVVTPPSVGGGGGGGGGGVVAVPIEPEAPEVITGLSVSVRILERYLEVKPGDKVAAEISISGLLVDRDEVLTFEVVDANGKVYASNFEGLSEIGSTKLLREIILPKDIATDKYWFSARVTRDGTSANGRDSFDVVVTKAIFPPIFEPEAGVTFPLLLLLLLIILVLLILMILWRRRKNEKHKKRIIRTLVHKHGAHEIRKHIDITEEGYSSESGPGITDKKESHHETYKKHEKTSKITKIHKPDRKIKSYSPRGDKSKRIEPYF